MISKPTASYSNIVMLFIGGCFVSIALFLGLALISYDPFDPSFNRAAGHSPSNLVGIGGAYIADLLLQIFGLANIILVFIPFYWGIRWIFQKPVTWLSIRLILFCIALISCSLLGAYIPTPAEWSLDIESLGGALGNFLYHKFLLMGGGESLLLAIAITIAGITGILATGLTVQEGKYFFGAVKRMCSMSSSSYRWLFQRLHSSSSVSEQERIEPLVERIKEELIEEEERKEETIEIFQESQIARKVHARPTSFRASATDYTAPSLDLLTKPSLKKKKQVTNQNVLSQNARLLEKVLSDFGVLGKIVKIRPGPVVTLYELEPAAGTKSSRVIGLADDIARSMSAVSARIAVIPGRNAIGIELPNNEREVVLLRELLEDAEYENASLQLPLALGKDIGGEVIIVDLARMPHLLVAGTTGSGKSVAINSMVLSFLYRLTPQQCRLIMIDPKMLELSVYDGIPHLLTPVVTEPSKAVVALKWTVKEMEHRYRLMSQLGVRNISGYNKRIKEAIDNNEILERTVQTGFEPETGQPIFEKTPLAMEPLPYIVVIVDEMADLMLVAGKDIEASIQRLAQMARAAGIHLIMATQRPSVDVITGVIKANFPTRISFQVTSKIDSRTILGEQGAEQLLGMGDLLYMAGGGRIIRAHGPFVDDKEVEKVVAYLKTQGEPQYIEEVTEAEEEEDEMAMSQIGGEEADLYRQAVAIVLRDKKPSISYVQRRLKIGYNRAASLIERMEKEGIVSPPNHTGKREILLKNASEIEDALYNTPSHF